MMAWVYSSFLLLCPRFSATEGFSQATVQCHEPL